MQIRTFYGSKKLRVFLLYDLGDEKALVCEIWCFYHNPNTLVDFLTLAPHYIADVYLAAYEKNEII